MPLLSFSFLFYLFVTAISHVKAGDPVSCDNNRGNYTANSAYDNNLKTLISTFSSHKQINYGFYNFSYGQDPDRAYAIGLCRGDQEQSMCLVKLNNSFTYLKQQCPNQKEAIVWGGEFTLWYSNRSIFGLVETDPTIYLIYERDVSDVDQYNKALGNLMTNLTNKAVSGDSRRKYDAENVYDTANFATIYGYVLCIPNLSSQQCIDCLEAAVSEIAVCCKGKMGGNILKPSCRIRFDPYRFYNSTIVLDSNATPPSPSLQPPSAITNNSYSPSTNNSSSSGDPVLCDKNRGNYTANSTYDSNLKTLISSFSTHKQINYGFYNFSYGQDPDRAYVIGLCRGDQEPNMCFIKLNNSFTYLKQQCPNQREAIVLGGEFTLWYSNRSIFGIVEDSPTLYLIYERRVTDEDAYIQHLVNLMANLAAQAASGDSRRKYDANFMYDPTNFATIYGYVQCMPDLTSQQCTACLIHPIYEIQKCCKGKMGANILKPSCRIRFDSYRFYNSTIVLESTNNTSLGGRSKIRTVIATTVPVAAVVLLLIFICIYLRLRKPKQSFEGMC